MNRIYQFYFFDIHKVISQLLIIIITTMERYSATETKWNTIIEGERNYWYTNII